ncbi:MAG: hypothetical protein J6334_07420, partial [Kiritimatiellae bacterium]|nr:hypothetical protein [Kiritimatiellia bacterium]
FFYVGVQIMCWTFIIQYGTRIFMERGMSEIDAEVLSQRYNIAAMILFCCSRFICTFLLKFFNPGALLGTLAAAGMALTVWVIFGGGNPDAGAALTQMLEGHSGIATLGIYLKAAATIPGMSGLIAMVAISICMSLMFPTIYGIALRGLGDDAKLGAAGLIMAIGGGCLMPPLQGAIMDLPAFNLFGQALASVRVSFVLPLLCFAVITVYGWCQWRRKAC